MVGKEGNQSSKSSGGFVEVWFEDIDSISHKCSRWRVAASAVQERSTHPITQTNDNHDQCGHQFRR